MKNNYCSYYGRVSVYQIAEMIAANCYLWLHQRAVESSQWRYEEGCMVQEHRDILAQADSNACVFM